MATPEVTREALWSFDLAEHTRPGPESAPALRIGLGCRGRARGRAEPRRAPRDRGRARRALRRRDRGPCGLLLRRHEQARLGSRPGELWRGRGREHDVGSGRGRGERLAIGRSDGPRWPAGDPRRRLGAVRDLAEGRRDRRARIDRAYGRVHGPEGLPGGVRRRRRVARGLPLRGAAVRSRLGRGARSGLHREGDALSSTWRRCGSSWIGRRGRRREPGRLPPLRVGAPPVQLPRRQPRARTDGHLCGVWVDERRVAPGAVRVGDVRPERDRGDPAGRARGHVRHPRVRRQASRSPFRRPAVPGRVGVPVSARGLSREVRHRRRDRDAVRA